MNFCWITLHVNDMEESLGFYQDIIGLEVAERFNPGEGREIAMLGKKDGTKVELIVDKNNPVCVQAVGLSVGFEVESLTDAMKLVNDNNIPVKRGPISPTPFTSFFFIDDPNGVEIQIVENKKV